MQCFASFKRKLESQWASLYVVKEKLTICISFFECTVVAVLGTVQSNKHPRLIRKQTRTKVRPQSVFFQNPIADYKIKYWLIFLTKASPVKWHYDAIPYIVYMLMCCLFAYIPNLHIYCMTIVHTINLLTVVNICIFFSWLPTEKSGC